VVVRAPTTGIRCDDDDLHEENKKVRHIGYGEHMWRSELRPVERERWRRLPRGRQHRLQTEAVGMPAPLKARGTERRGSVVR
jgi:hypothetical protein